MGADTEPVYETAEGVKKIIGLSVKTIYRMAANDPTFPSLRLGGSIRFPRARVIQWFREREQGRGQHKKRPAGS